MMNLRFHDETTRFIGLESDDELATEPDRLRQQYLMHWAH